MKYYIISKRTKMRKEEGKEREEMKERERMRERYVGIRF